MMTHRLVRSLRKCRFFVPSSHLHSCRASPFHSNSILLSSEAMSMEETPLVTDSSVVLVSHAEGATAGQPGEVEGDSLVERSLSAMTLRRLLDEQKRYLNELRVQMKAQGILLCSLQEESSFLKSKPRAKQTEQVAISAILPAQENGEAVLDTAYKEEGLCEDHAYEGSHISSNACEGNVDAGSYIERIGKVDTTTLQDDAHEGSHISTNACEGNSDVGLSIESIGNVDTTLSHRGFEGQVFQHLPWPEWALFLDRLRPFARIQQGTPAAAVNSAEIFKDMVVLKHALVKFAQTNDFVFRMLSPKDLHMLALYEYSKVDERTAVAKKRLQDYVRSLESDVSPMESDHASQAKLTDVMRLIYIAVRNLGGTAPSDSTSGLGPVLQALNSMNIVKPNDTSSKEDGSLVGSKQIKEGPIYSKVVQGICEKPKVSDLDNTWVDSGAVEQTPNPSTSQDESMSFVTVVTDGDITLSEGPKYASIKERVDARRARLAKERLEKEAKISVTEKQEKEAVNLLLSKPFLSHKMGPKNSEKSSNDGHSAVITRNFDALDAIIDSDHSDDDVASRITRSNTFWASSSSSVKRKA